MKALWLSMSAAAALVMAGPVSADAEIAKKNGCLACHAVDKKVVGPALQDVAAKYKGDANGKATIMESIKSGSRGKYGSVPMPPQGRVSDADREALAAWIVSLAK